MDGPAVVARHDGRLPSLPLRYIFARLRVERSVERTTSKRGHGSSGGTDRASHGVSAVALSTARCAGSRALLLASITATLIAGCASSATTSTTTHVPTSTSATNSTTAAPQLPSHPTVGVGGGFACAGLSTGSVECWGDDVAGELGTTATLSHRCGGDACSRTPVDVDGISTVSTVSVGRSHACALLRDGHVWCWGDNQAGELGNGTTASSSTPVEVQGISDAVAVSAGGSGGNQDFTCVLLSGGHVECWGYDADGELGNASTSNTPTPVPVSGLADAVAISSGGSAVCAVLSSATVSCWGSDDAGQIGMPIVDSPVATAGQTFYTSPMPVAGLPPVSGIAAGPSSTCAVTKTGGVYCWGDNYDGELGNGTTSGPQTCHGQQVCRYTPGAVIGVSDATSITNGSYAPCATVASGRIECWGGNYNGELGNGKVSNTPDPNAAPVVGITNATAVSAGSGGSSCALLKTTAVMCWGANGAGELGTGSTQPRDPTPANVHGIGG